MATDFFVSMLFVPVLVIIFAIILLRIFMKKTWLNTTIFDLQWGSLLSGTLGALFGLYLFTAATSYFEAVNRVTEYDSLREQGVLSLAWGWSIYLFILLAPFFMVGFALLLFPILAVLSKLRLVSALGVFLIAMILVATNAGLTYLHPNNSWCETNHALCVQKSVLETLGLALPVAFGFSIGAQLPFLFTKRAVK